MKTPDKIWLIDNGDEIVWCDDPTPGEGMEEKDAAAYVRAPCDNAQPMPLFVSEESENFSRTYGLLVTELAEAKQNIEDLRLINAELTDALIAANLDRAELRDPDLNNARVTRKPVADLPDER